MTEKHPSTAGRLAGRGGCWRLAATVVSVAFGAAIAACAQGAADGGGPLGAADGGAASPESGAPGDGASAVDARGETGASDARAAATDSSGVSADGSTDASETEGDGAADGAGEPTDAPLDAPASPRDAAPESSTDAAETDASLDAAPDASCPVSSLTDYCAEIPRLPALPVIDGSLDCGPALLGMSPRGWSGPAPLPAFPGGNSASIAVAWRPDGLYLYVQVVTPAAIAADPGSPPYDGAGVEVYLDSDGAFPIAPQYDTPGAMQLVAASPQNGAVTAFGEGYRNASDQGPWAPSHFGTFPTATGFVFEAFVVASDLGLATWSLAGGSLVGLDLAVDVSYATAATTGPQQHREGQYFLHVAAPPIGAPYDDPRAFCTPTLN